MGRATEIDEWGRDDELGGASSWAIFRIGKMRRDDEMTKRAKEVLGALDIQGQPHKLLASHHHAAHALARNPRPLKEVGECVKKVMEGYREAFMRVEELWFDQEVAVMCGGWIEVLVRAVEETEGLELKKDGDEPQGVVVAGRRGREKWVVELVGGVAVPRAFWPAQGGFEGAENTVDFVPADWTPGEGDWSTSEEGQETEWGGSTGMDGDISWNGSEDEDEDLEEDGVRAEHRNWATVDWAKLKINGEDDDDDESIKGWGTVAGGGWGNVVQDTQVAVRIPPSSRSSTGGWDGDASDVTS